MSRLRVWWQSFLMRFWLVRQFCRSCGRCYEEVWTISPMKWYGVMGESSEPHCISCFSVKAAAKGYYVEWRDASWVRYWQEKAR